MNSNTSLEERRTNGHIHRFFESQNPIQNEQELYLVVSTKNTIKIKQI